jgi:hypothetical protein
MDPYSLDNFRRWFDSYSSRFFRDDEFVNAHLRTKQEHTAQTCREILVLAEQLALDEHQKQIAEMVALFHDVGRFPQFAEYRTFNDGKSVDHARLSIEVLRREGILDVLRREDRQWVETAVEQHNRKALPAPLTGQALLFAKLIRDADKLDIFRQIAESYDERQKSPMRQRLEIEFPDEPRCSPAVVEAILKEEVVDYGALRTLSDMRLCQLAWVYDLNFGVSLTRLCERGFPQQILSHLPATPETDRVRDKVSAYLAAKGCLTL